MWVFFGFGFGFGFGNTLVGGLSPTAGQDGRTGGGYGGHGLGFFFWFFFPACVLVTVLRSSGWMDG